MIHEVDAAGRLAAQEVYEVRILHGAGGVPGCLRLGDGGSLDHQDAVLHGPAHLREGGGQESHGQTGRFKDGVDFGADVAPKRRVDFFVDDAEPLEIQPLQNGRHRLAGLGCAHGPRVGVHHQDIPREVIRRQARGYPRGHQERAQPFLGELRARVPPAGHVVCHDETTRLVHHSSLTIILANLYGGAAPSVNADLTGSTGGRCRMPCPSCRAIPPTGPRR